MGSKAHDVMVAVRSARRALVREVGQAKVKRVNKPLGALYLFVPKGEACGLGAREAFSEWLTGRCVRLFEQGSEAGANRERAVYFTPKLHKPVDCSMSSSSALDRLSSSTRQRQEHLCARLMTCSAERMEQSMGSTAARPERPEGGLHALAQWRIA